MLHLTGRKPADFLAAVEDDPLEPLYTLALTTGMRLGEVLGLRWQAVDDANLQVRVTLTGTAGNWSLTEPKTPKSRRQDPFSTTDRAAPAEGRAGRGGCWLATHGQTMGWWSPTSSVNRSSDLGSLNAGSVLCSGRPACR